jgi:dipeptidase D
MNESLLNLEPKVVWKNFVELTKIPRPSKKEEQVIKFVKEFGEKLGLETIVDEVGNVIIRKPATKGFENKKGIILQGHLDMVPQKNSDKVHDFEKDPITCLIDGEWVKADGTTLGADNGMGVALAMAVLEAKDLQHPMIEALFTTDEETGMAGAFGLKAGLLKGDILINLDSEDEGGLCIGCAGGIDANIDFIYDSVKPEKNTAYKIDIKGLKGGHSGVDIHLGRGNANKLLFRFLLEMDNKYGIELSAFEIGNMRNAIPREGWVVITIDSENAEDFENDLAEYQATLKNEFYKVDAGVTITATKTELPEFVIDLPTQIALLNAIQATPNGVIRMDQGMEGLVETSTNLSIVKLDAEVISIKALIRSSVDTAKMDVVNMFDAVYTLANADKIWFEGEYPGWKPNPDSAILEALKGTYEKMFNKKPHVYAIHAGLECGLLGGVYKNWDMISVGPTIKYPHSPDEKVEIATVKKVWDLLVETLKQI